MRGLVLFICTLTAVIGSDVHASAIGAPEKTGRIGYGITAGLVSVEDPNGKSERVSDLFPFNLVYTDQWLGGFRYWAELFYQETTFDASTSDVGQDASRLGLRLSVQKRLRIPQPWEIWGGIGLYAGREEFTVRHTVDADGFLSQAFPDRSETILGVQFDLVSEWTLNRRWDIATKALYSLPFGDGIEELSISVLFLYKLNEL